MTVLCSAPTLAEVGEEGTELWANLELKLVADVGIIGIPSAGKSTLLSVLSNAKPKIADYPFTTLVPNLGVCELDYRTTVFADIPGTGPICIGRCGPPGCMSTAVIAGRDSSEGHVPLLGDRKPKEQFDFWS